MELLDSEMAMIHPSSNPWLFTNGSTSAITGPEREKFKKELISYYGVRHADGRVTCMVSGQALKTGDVVAAHIWPAHARDSFGERWFNLSDGALDSARNGIIMAAALEEKFDKLRISFRWDDEAGNFRCVVLNKRLRGKGQNVPGLFIQMALVSHFPTSMEWSSPLQLMKYPFVDFWPTTMPLPSNWRCKTSG